MAISPVQIQKFLGGIGYPAKKQDLVAHAQQRGAPKQVIELLQQLPDKEEFETPADVSKAMGEIE